MTFAYQSIFRELTTHRKKIVVFADGIMPGEGTSASENSSDGDEFSTKRAIARSKNRKRNPRNSPSISPNDINSAIDKENSDENKVNSRNRRCHTPTCLTTFSFVLRSLPSWH